MAETAPYGSWRSPLSARSLVQGAAGIAEVRSDPVRPWLLWWAESRPDEGGRTAVMRCDLRSGDSSEASPPDANARTLAHQYGGGAWWPHDGDLYYCEFEDQRLYRLTPGDEPVPLTPSPGVARALRFADGRVTPDGRWCVCVGESDFGEGEPVNRIVAVDSGGSGRIEELWAASDFVMSPRLSPDGSMLAWVAWNHPDMPWDATRLHVHELLDGELGRELTVISGDRSLCEPDWDHSRPSRLLVCSDHEGWWGVYEADLSTGELRPVLVGDFDVATPPWVFGMQRWTSVDGVIVAAAGIGAGDRLLVGGEPLRTPDTAISSLTAVSLSGFAVDAVAYAGGAYDHETEVVVIALREDAETHEQDAVETRDVPDGVDFDGSESTVRAAPSPRARRRQDEDDEPARPGIEAEASRRVVRAARDLGLDPALLVTPEAVAFPSGTDGTCEAHGLYYRPANPAHCAPAGERPPLLVMAHGGPTAAARRQLQLGIVYWTSRGVAVVDVDYRGSTGYGRAYRRALDGAWGQADVEDCVAAARFLVERGDVDPDRLIIRGGSAGGFTVLAALAFHDVFAAGASSYGIADLEALAADTHKFESRYLDRLIGPYPQARRVYRDRSPIHHIDRLDAPMIVLQGSEDEIVPPAQAEMIVAALRAKGVPVSYLLFDGEQHGFRKADNIVAALEAELAFFGEILGFAPADALLAPDIHGLR